MKVKGRGGRRPARAAWAGDARAYLGMTTPGFPNFFMIYGPNTNIVVNGSIIFFSECAVRYIVGALKLLAETGARRMEAKQDVHDAFNARVDEANKLDGLGLAASDQLVQERASAGSARTGPSPWSTTGAPRWRPTRPTSGWSELRRPSPNRA